MRGCVTNIHFNVQNLQDWHAQSCHYVCMHVCSLCLFVSSLLQILMHFKDPWLSDGISAISAACPYTKKGGKIKAALYCWKNIGLSALAKVNTMSSKNITVADILVLFRSDYCNSLFMALRKSGSRSHLKQNSAAQLLTGFSNTQIVASFHWISVCFRIFLHKISLITSKAEILNLKWGFSGA